MKKETIAKSSRVIVCSLVFAGMGLHVSEGLAHKAMDPDMWMAPEQAAHLENPVPADTSSIARGKEVFLQSCSACHGENAEGLDAQTVGLEKSPPNLKERINMHPDGDFFWKIQEGRGEMPSFKDEMTSAEMWDVINFIRKESN